ncbi:reverse transcriptase domain-containing protein [Tanacetum coccineum]
MIREGGNRKRSFEEGRSGLTDELTFPTIPQNQLTDEPIILEGIIEGNQVRRILVDGGSSSEIMRNTSSLGVIDLRVTMGRAGRSKTVLMEFAIINCCSPYNVIIGRTRMRSLKAVERVQDLRKEVQWRQREEQMSRIREQVILRTKSSSGRGPNLGPVLLEKTWDKEDTEEVCIISHERLNRHVMMETTLTTDCKQLLTKVLRENMEVFAWAGSEGTTVPRFVMEHQLKIYPFAEPVEYSQIRMTEDDEEKTGFHTEERVYCFTYMPKELKNSMAILQKMVKKVLADQKGRNMEMYLEEIVIKSKRRNVSRLYGNTRRSKSRARECAGEKVEGTPDANEGGTFNLNRKLQAKSTLTPRAWRLYLGRETIEEGSGVGIILVSLKEKMYSYAIRLKFNASNHAMDCEALLTGVAVSVSKGMKDLHVFMDSSKLVSQTEGNHTPEIEQERKYKKEILDATTLFYRLRITHIPKILNFKAEVLTGLATIKLEFLNQEVSTGIKTRPSVEETSSSKKGKARSNVPSAKPSYNGEASGNN